MTGLFTPQVGAVFSADIAVPEHQREKRFYSRVLSTGANPLWREADLLNNLEMPIIGLGQRTPEYADLPLQWMPHIQVADVAASVRRASELGGTVLMHSTDEEGTSQWAVLRDPNGAAFGIVPVVDAEAIPGGEGAASTDEPPPVGRILWMDLTVPDAAATRDFYREVIGWTTQEIEMEDGGERYADYAMIGPDANGLAGVCYARGANAGLPPVWMLYVAVGDLEESLRRVEEEGGEVVRRGDTAEEHGIAYAVIRDPVGAYMGLMPG